VFSVVKENRAATARILGIDRRTLYRMEERMNRRRKQAEAKSKKMAAKT